MINKRLIIPKSWFFRYLLFTLGVKIVTLMKLLLASLVLLLLQGCLTQTAQPQPAILTSDIPSQWQLEGRIGVVSYNKVQSVGVEIKFNQSMFEATLMGALGLGQITIESGPRGVWVNRVQIAQPLKTWMRQKFGWYFPIKHLGEVVFKHRMAADEWSVEKMTFQQIQGQYYPKLVKFKHKTQPINIKLLVQNIIRE